MAPLRNFIPLLVALCLVLFSIAPLSANEDLYGIQIRNKGFVGGDLPAVIIQANAKLKTVRITLRSGSITKKFKTRNMRPGARKIFTFKHSEGERDWVATIEVKSGGQSSSSQIRFSTAYYGPPKIRIEKRDVFIKDKCVRAHLNRSIAKIELEVRADGGVLIEKVSRDFNDGGDSEKICWERSGEVLELLQVIVYDEHGFYTGMEVSPFEVHIPHDDVVFASGEADIRPDEEHKLKTTLGALKAALRKHGKLLKIELYVAGYTDTVGSGPDNERLSEARARSIARWYRKQGIRVSILFAGFGERVLAAPTGDNVDEARNRRALYILSNGPPVGRAVPNARWKKL